MPQPSPAEPPRRPRRRSNEPLLPNIRAIGRPWEPHKDLYHFLLRRSWTGFFTVVGLGTNPSGNAEGFVATVPSPAGLSLAIPACALALFRRRRHPR